MINIINWLFGKKDVTAQGVTVVPKDKSTKTYLLDPVYPNMVISQPEISPKLNMRSVGESGGGYKLGSLQQQAYGLKLIVNDALNYMSSKSPKPIKNWAAVSSLTLMPRAGKDLNAYYDRTSLKFFYFTDPVTRKMVYACDARPVVSHEFGHAFLDILRPDWWNTQCVEVWAYHEAFGDITATLNSLQYDDLIDNAISETNGDLMKSNILTRLASQMGAGLYHMTNGKNGELPNCLRDLTAFYAYEIPESLPSQGRDDQLLSECHSFSRVFSGAFWEILVRIANQQVASSNIPLKNALKLSRDIMADYVIKATINAPTTVRLFDAMARQMIMIDKNQGGKYQKILSDVFGKRKIIVQRILMLEDSDFQSVLQGINEPHEIQNHGDTKIIKTFGNKTLKLIDKLGPISTLENNPLMGLEIVVPDQSAYYFDKNKLIDIISNNEAEVIDSAYTCLKMLHENKLVGKGDQSIFEEKGGKLIRKQIICTCGKPNYCDPNAPEYRKPWKPANNSGCTSCYNKNCLPQSCDCEAPEKAPAPKLGCYTKVKAGAMNSYRVGSSASRKVC